MKRKKLSSPPQGALQRSVQGWVRPLLHQTGGKRRWHEMFMIDITITMKTTMIMNLENLMMRQRTKTAKWLTKWVVSLWQ